MSEYTCRPMIANLLYLGNQCDLYTAATYSNSFASRLYRYVAAVKQGRIGTMRVVKTWYGLTDMHAHQHKLTDLTVTSCNIEYLLGHSSKGTVDSAPLATVHYLHCEVFSNVCMSERHTGFHHGRVESTTSK